VVTPAFAALLVEVKHHLDGDVDQMPDRTVELTFAAGDGRISRLATDADVGRTFTADVQNLELMNSFLTQGEGSATAWVRAHTQSERTFHVTSDAKYYQTGTTVLLVEVDRIAPSRGENLYGYQITDVTQTIDFVRASGSPDTFFVHAGEQTIRIYGDAVDPVPGDYNRNNVVDAADYIVWRNNPATLPNEGASLGVVNQDDYNFWRANFGRSAFSSGSSHLAAALPEPATWVMLATATFASQLAFRRKLTIHSRL
jgi:hypothetical protein